MKKLILVATAACCMLSNAEASYKKSGPKIPPAVEDALRKKYPNSGKVHWEKEKGNFEANWGGKSGEEMSVLFTPSGTFLEQVEAIDPAMLPARALAYLKKTYHTKISEAGKVTDAAGKITFEAELKHEEVIFDDKGNYLKTEN